MLRLIGAVVILLAMISIVSKPTAVAGEVEDAKRAGIDLGDERLTRLAANPPDPYPVPGSDDRGLLILEDFSDSPLELFPIRWRPKGKNGHHFYRVAEEEGNRYLRVDAVRDATSIFRKVNWDLKKYPILEWRWRGRIIPEGSNERKSSKNDSTVGLYVVFPVRLFVPDSLKYLWSGVLPVNDAFSNGFLSTNKIRVLESGTENLGKWIFERRNILEDYLDRFNKKRTNKSPIAIGVITDGDQTDSLSSGDYDDFRILTKEAAARLQLGELPKVASPPKP